MASAIPNGCAPDAASGRARAWPAAQSVLWNRKKSVAGTFQQRAASEAAFL